MRFHMTLGVVLDTVAGNKSTVTLNHSTSTTNAPHTLNLLHTAPQITAVHDGGAPHIILANEIHDFGEFHVVGPNGPIGTGAYNLELVFSLHPLNNGMFNYKRRRTS